MAGLNIILDLAAVIVVAAFTLRGVSRGFVRSVTTLAVVILSYFGARFASQMLAPFLAQIIEPLLWNIDIAAIINEETLSSVHIAGVNVADLEFFEEAIEQLAHGTEQVVGELIAGAALKIAQAIISIVVFIVLAIVLWAVFKAIGLVAKLPVLSFINRLAGLLFGAATGIIVMLILASVCGIFSAYVTAEIVDATLAYKYFANPMLLFN